MATISDVSGATKTIKTPALSVWDFTMTNTPQSIFVSGASTNNVTVKDTLYNSQTLVTTQTVALVTVQNNFNFTQMPSVPVLTSLDPSIATIDSTGLTHYVSGGNCRIQAQTQFCSRQVTVPISEQSGSINTYTNYIAGSACLNAQSNVQTLITACAAAGYAGGSYNAMAIWSTRDDNTPNYVWSTTFWGASLDFTCCSPWNSWNGHKCAGTLISPRHIIFAHHYLMGIGSTIRFIKPDNTIVTKTITGSAQVGTTDFQIGILDSDVPTGITFATVLNNTGIWSSQMPGAVNWYRTPCVALNQDKFAYVCTTLGRGTNFGSPIYDATRIAFDNYPRVGDSGGPVFIVLNNKLVLLTTLEFVFGNLNEIADSHAAINTVMSTLSTAASAGTNYQLTDADLSGFGSY